MVGGTELPFIFFFLSIVVAAAFGGLRPALLAIVLSALTARWFFFEPLHSLSITSWNMLVSLLTFVFVSSLIAGAIEKVHRERNLLFTTLHSIGDAVIVTDVRARVTFLNHEAEKLTGWKFSEGKGQTLRGVFRIVDEFTRQPAANPAEKALRYGSVTGLANHTILMARDGKEVAIDDSAAPIRDLSGKMVGAVLAFRDITERRAAQRAASRLTSIIESSDDAIIGKDLDGIITNWNQAAERMFGYTAAEMIGKSIRTLIPSDRQEEEDRILAALQQGERVDHLETIRKSRDGREVQVSMSSSPIKDGEGRIVGASKIARDITRRKAMEAELAQVHAELEDHARKLEATVRERTAHLQATIAELEGVSYSLSHDIGAFALETG